MEFYLRAVCGGSESIENRPSVVANSAVVVYDKVLY